MIIAYHIFASASILEPIFLNLWLNYMYGTNKSKNQSFSWYKY